MATSQKTPSLNNDREQLKNLLSKELTEKLKNCVNTYAILELSERLDALKKASGIDTLNQIAAMRERVDVLNKTSALSIALDDLNKATSLDTLNKIAAIKERFDALNKKTSALIIALDDLNKTTSLDTLNKIASIKNRLNTLNGVASKALFSFNLYPLKSFESNLKNINYPTSIEHALARDWQNVGNDLWKSYLTVSGNQLSDNDE